VIAIDSILKSDVTVNPPNFFCASKVVKCDSRAASVGRSRAILSNIHLPTIAALRSTATASSILVLILWSIAGSFLHGGAREQRPRGERLRRSLERPSLAQSGRDLRVSATHRMQQNALDQTASANQQSWKCVHVRKHSAE
jgi:hypothetical protein